MYSALTKTNQAATEVVDEVDDESLAALRERLCATADAAVAPVDTRIDRVLDRFGPYLRHFHEIGVALESRRVSAVSFGSDDGFFNRIVAQLEADGATASAREDLRALRSTVDSWIFARIQVSNQPAPPLGVYFRQPMHTDSICALLAHRGVEPSALRRVRGVAEVLQQRYTRMFAAIFRPGLAPSYRLFFAVESADRSAQDRAADALRRLELAPAGSALWPVLDTVATISETDCPHLLLSLSFVDGRLAEAVNLGVFCVDVPAVHEALAQQDLWTPESADITRIGEATNQRVAAHVGFRCAGSDRPSVSAFFASADA